MVWTHGEGISANPTSWKIWVDGQERLKYFTLIISHLYQLQDRNFFPENHANEDASRS